MASHFGRINDNYEAHGMKAKTTHADLMRQMGTPPEDGFDPMPPRQHAYLLDVDEPTTNRAIAWVWSKTIRPGRGRHRSPIARDERGLLTHVHAAADLGWTPSNAKLVFDKLADQMRIRIDEKGAIQLRGDAPEPRRVKADESEPNGDEQEGEDEANGNMYIFRSSRLSLIYQQLTKNERTEAAAQLSELQKFENAIKAQAIQQARAIADEIEKQWEKRWFARVGVAYEEETRGRPKTAPVEPLLNFSLRAVPEFVHISEVDSVHKAGEASVHKDFEGVHIRPPYISSEVRDTEEDYRAAGSPAAEESGPFPAMNNEGVSSSSGFQSRTTTNPIEQALADYGPPDAEAVATLAARVRKIAPQATPAEIVHFIHAKGPLAQPTKNPIGFLLTAVPKCFAGNYGAHLPDTLLTSPPATRQAADPRAAATEEFMRRHLEELEDAAGRRALHS